MFVFQAPIFICHCLLPSLSLSLHVIVVLLIELKSKKKPLDSKQIRKRTYLCINRCCSQLVAGHCHHCCCG